MTKNRYKEVEKMNEKIGRMKQKSDDNFMYRRASIIFKPEHNLKVTKNKA